MFFTTSFYTPTGAPVQDLGQLEENIRNFTQTNPNRQEDLALVGRRISLLPALSLVIATINPPCHSYRCYDDSDSRGDVDNIQETVYKL
jgi:hypothetical protein